MPTPLPRPFEDGALPPADRAHARALWSWHLALQKPVPPAGAGTGRPDDATLDDATLGGYFAEEAERARRGGALRLVDEATWRAAYGACQAARHPRELLASQIVAARLFAGSVRFEDTADVNAFIAAWAHPHARLLAGLYDVRGSWQLPHVDALATGFFWVGRLVYLADELARGWCFIPQVDLDGFGVTLDQLKGGRLDEPLRRLLWKQTIRARDALAHGEDIVRDLPRRHASAAKRWWFGALEVLNEIERRGYDVWSKPVRLSRRHLLQIHFQARFGRTTFRR